MGSASGGSAPHAHHRTSDTSLSESRGTVIRRRLLTLVAALSSLPLALATAPSAHAADPTTMTNGFYVDPHSSAKRWVAANQGDGRAPAINASIANTPTARWFGSWSSTIGTATGAYACSPLRRNTVRAVLRTVRRDPCPNRSVAAQC